MDACVEMALVASELASNAVRHGGGGWLLARVVPGGIQIICQDRGPGIDDPSAALVDGWSEGRRVTAEAPARGGLGTGLGTARRLSHALTFSRGAGLFTVVAFRFDELPRRLRQKE
jgi:serine/threonine-protein kinase RsbT